MKIDEIRAKFPQYNDLSDDQLVIGLHKKYYSDIPLPQFTKSIQYNAPDPTEGMNEGEKFRAGMGKAFTDVARGIGQFVGATSRADIAESRRLDKPLMNTGAGLAGNIGGNVSALAPTAFIPGAATLPGAALIGAGTGLAQPSVGTGETLGNMAIGGVAAPTALLAGRGIAAGYQGAKGLIEPLTKSGQERIAAQVLQSSATNPQQAAANLANARALVPGSSPTVGQAARDPGLAQLERTLLNNQEYAPTLQNRFAQQRAARLGQVANVAGTDDYFNAIKQGRSIFANEDYGKALAQGVDQKMAQAMAPQIENLMQRPSIQRAQQTARMLAAESGQAIDNFGSVQGLDWLKKALDNRISAATQPGSAIGKEELRALTQTKNDLMQTLEQISPAYKQANDSYAAMSKQVNGMQVARSLMDKLQRPGSEYSGGSAKEMGDAFSRALSQSQESVKKATGMNKTISDVMPTRDISMLENVALDLGRKAFAENAGKASGSNTAQNLASQNMLRRMLGPTGLPQSWAESTMLQTMLSPVQIASKLSGADKRMMDRIALSLLDPADAAGLLGMPITNAGQGLLGGNAQRFLPPAGLLGLQFNQQ